MEAAYSALDQESSEAKYKERHQQDTIACRRVQHRFRKIGGVEEGIVDVGDPAPDGGGWQHGQNPTIRSHGFRVPQGKGRSAIAQRNVEASGRGCGRPHNFDSRSFGRVALVDHVHISEDVDGSSELVFLFFRVLLRPHQP